MISVSDLWIFDVSGSMAGGRIMKMREAVRAWHKANPNARLLCFCTTLLPVTSLEEMESIEPYGGTNLHLALQHAAELMAGNVTVFTDGEPTDEEACFTAAANVPGVVNCVFCGDENDRDAKKFCDKLSRDNGGKFVAKDILKGQSLICAEVRDLLSLPAPIAL